MHEEDFFGQKMTKKVLFMHVMPLPTHHCFFSYQGLSVQRGDACKEQFKEINSEHVEAHVHEKAIISLN